METKDRQGYQVALKMVFGTHTLAPDENALVC
jgi:hypothetical protein